MREDNDDVPDGTVLKEFRRGFRLGAQLLRPAMVQVTSSVQLVVCTLFGEQQRSLKLCHACYLEQIRVGEL